MPHFTLSIGPHGPLLGALIGVSKPRADALTAAGQPIPQAVPITGLIDTGASCTCIDPSVLLTSLSLTPTGSVLVNTPSTGATPHDTEQFDVALVIPATAGMTPLLFPTIPVISSELLVHQGFHALIGRDILDRCLLVYDGAAKTFTLAF
ncbi:MAG TPA: hypothetical protein VGC93_15365 [Thermoanaerobaculia bacterium]